MNRLYDITHDPRLPVSKWCGPAALSAILGITAECAAAWVKHLNGTARVMGTSWDELGKVVREFGLDMKETGPNHRGITVARWFRTRPERHRDRTVLVAAGHHWFVVRGNIAVHNQQGRVRIGAYNHRRAWVTNVYEIYQVGNAWESHTQKRAKDAWPPNCDPESVKVRRSAQRARSRSISSEVSKRRCTLEKGTWDQGRMLDFPPGYSFSGCHSMCCWGEEEVMDYLQGMSACPMDCDCHEEVGS